MALYVRTTSIHYIIITVCILRQRKSYIAICSPQIFIVIRGMKKEETARKKIETLGRILEITVLNKIAPESICGEQIKFREIAKNIFSLFIACWLLSSKNILKQ